MAVFDPADERRWAQMPDKERVAEHERLRDNYLGQLEERVCQLDFARRHVEFLEAEVERVRARLGGHNGELPSGKRRPAQSERKILASDSERMRLHREHIERKFGAGSEPVS